MILRYEDLRDKYEETLDKIANEFNLVKKHDKYIQITKYKGTYTAEYYKKPILLSEDIQEYIKQNIDLHQEKQLGYLL
jgi:thioredoxin-related protein